jgi:signal transduction histidine kinase/ligand-binding sensor domain-containing protein
MAMRAILALGILLGWVPGAYALDPALDVSQYAHTAWQFREGFTQGYTRSIAQTPDGYIWLGTGFGLFRFDGLRVEHWQPPLNGEQLPSNVVVSLDVARDGTFWIGTTKGLASWRDSRLTRYPKLAGLIIASILEDRNGTVWVGGIYSVASRGKLCAIDGTNVDCYESDAVLGSGVTGLYEDSHHVLWVVGRDGVWRWRPGPPRFYHMPFGKFAVHNLGEADDGTLLIPLTGRLARLGGGKLETQHPYPAPARNVEGIIFLRDRDGGVWIGTDGAGVVHLHQGRAEVFSQADGLSGDDVTSLFEDREGDVWVATVGGLDRFRNYAVATYAQHEGLGTIPGWGSVVAGRDGSIWMGTNDGLRMWNHGEVTIFGRADDHKSPSRTVWLNVHYVASRGLRDHVSVSVFADNSGRILVSTPYSFGYMENGRFVAIRGVPGGVVSSVAQDRQGNLWIANQDQGLLRLSKDGTVQRISWASIGHKDGAQSVAADRSTWGLWLGFDGGGVAYFSDGQIKETYGRAEELGNGTVSALHIETDDTVWAATEDGLSRIKNGRVLTLTSKNGLPCDAVHWITQDENHSFWLQMTCGLVRIGRGELDAWSADSQRKVKTTVFDSSDGVSSAPIGFHAGSQVVRSLDGKMWFQGFSGGASVIDPQHLPNNKITPPVHIEQISADRKTYWQNSYGDASSSPPRLPPLVRDLTIDYTALSLVVPEKVRFRVKLEGWDPDWKDAGNERKAFYSNLPPRTYRFRVMACNNSGVWNEAGTFLDFSIAPAYYQTRWFQLSCVAAFLALLWMLYQLRVRQLARQFNMRMEERVNERTRIARELHDTLLQSFQALMLHFQTGIDLLPGRPVEARKTLEVAIDRADQSINEGRDAVQGLRASAVETNDLVSAVRILGEELGAADTNQNSAVFEVEVEGAPRNLHPILRDEVYRIAAEALRNAFRHAQAQRIEVEILYGERWLRLRVRDDGKGIDPKFLSGDGRAGHYGLHGMSERAKLVRGKLAVWSKLDSGTEVELSIPASTAYATSSRRRSWLSEKFSGKGMDAKETDVKETKTKS